MPIEVALITAYDDQGRLLLGHRRDNGKWTLPGGHLEPGEAPAEGGRRELYEETGLRPTSFSYLNEYVVPPGVAGQEPLKLYCYSAFVHGIPHSDNDPDQEVDMWKFVDISEGLASEYYNNLMGPTPNSGHNLVANLFDIEEKRGVEKSEDLEKGSLQSRFKFNPDHVAGADEEAIDRWQGPLRDGAVDRESVPYMGGHERIRALHRLAAATPTRRGPDGQVQYLLHRGMSPEEKLATHGTPGYVSHADSMSSWTPSYSTAQSFASSYNNTRRTGADSHVVSAWFPHDAIHSIPKQYGALKYLMHNNSYADGRAAGAPKVRGANDYDNEHEVIVQPHTSQLAAPHEVQASLGKIKTPDEMVNRRGGKMPFTAQQQYHMGELKRSEELFEDLMKAVDPSHFSSIVKATDPQAKSLVDHTPDLSAHPPSMDHLAKSYNDSVLNSSQKVSGKSSSSAGLSAGITRKKVFKYQTPGSTEPGKAMTKPYHERVIQRCNKWMKYPIQGWAEMTTQSMFHAGGIGNLHQKVHVAEHNMGAGHEKEPALVVHLAPGHKTIGDGGMEHYDDSNPESDINSRKIAIMDFLANNNDRHNGNLMIHQTTGQPLAIDHSRNFQYIRAPIDYNHPAWNKEGEDSFHSYASTGALRRVANPVTAKIRDSGSDRHKAFYDAQHDGLEKYSQAFDWWGDNGAKIRQTFHDRLGQIKDPEVQEHLKRNFDARADWLDERSKFGLENYGTDWYKDPVPLYKPDQLTDDEKDDPEVVQRWQDRRNAKRDAKKKARAGI